MIYFTSDLHFGHISALNFSSRKDTFSNIDNMNQTLINNINDTVLPKDELYILGDFSCKLSKERVIEIRKQIKCKKVHLIRGNHDRTYNDNSIFQSVLDYKVLKVNSKRIVLFHYPILEWDHAHYGTIHLHGHIHSDGRYNEENLKKRYVDRFPDGHTPKNPDLMLRIYDVGVDANNYRPISLEKILNIMCIE